METRSNYPGSIPIIHENRTSTVTVASENISPTSAAANTLRLTSIQGQQERRRVSWTIDTVDNEMMNKKKSKCCCVYQKPRTWDESSEEDENEDHDCQNCRGHRKADYNAKRQADSSKNDANDVKEMPREEHASNCNLHH